MPSADNASRQSSDRLDGLDGRAAQQLVAVARALDAGRLDIAERGLAAIPEHARGHAEGLRLQAGLLGARGRHGEAATAMRRALALRPDDGLYHNTLGTLLGEAGDYDGAVAALRESCRLQPQLALAWYNLGVLLTRSVRNDEAVEALREAVRLQPGHSDAQALLADLLRMTGRTEEAAADYRRILAAEPTAGMAWWGLADLRGQPFSEADIATMQGLLRRVDLSTPNRVAIGFALARALDGQQRLTESLDVLMQAHAVARSQRDWNAAAFAEGLASVRAAFAQSSSVSPASLGEGVIFIVSLPRSGSTLVEQILASHSQVAGAGELPDLPQVLAEESRRRGQPFPQWVGAMQPADWQRLGERYLARTSHWRKERPGFTDKLPNNWMYLDAIRAMLPAARVVICRRDPLETCFSCYRQHLPNSAYTHTFDDLAAFWRAFDTHVQAAAERHPGQVYEHRYEALLAAPEARIRQLLAFCGLPFEEDCLRFHQSSREVRSPSASQVRRPLQGDTAQGARYGALLDPLRAALHMARWSS